MCVYVFEEGEENKSLGGNTAYPLQANNTASLEWIDCCVDFYAIGADSVASDERRVKLKLMNGT